MHIHTDIYYNFRIKNFVFTIYSGEYVENGTDWGLFNYDFILTLFIKQNNTTFEIDDANTIFEGLDEKRDWWQYLMLTYHNEGFLRKEWAEKYGLVPPPPPPPQSTDWLIK